MLVALPALAVAIGILAWAGKPLLLPAATVFPFLWAFAPRRLCAALVSAGYFLSASRDLPIGVANYFSTGVEAGLVLWLFSALVFVAVHTALWKAQPTLSAAWRYLLAALLMSIPPLGIVGWAHPVTAAGILLPGWGWFGLGAATIGLLVMTTRFWPIAILTFGGLWIWSAMTWTSPSVPQGWIGVDTQFGGAHGAYADYWQQQATIEEVREAARQGSRVLVLPEGAAGIWSPTVERLWTSRLQGLDVSINTGAILVGQDGYDNAMLEVSDRGIRILYRQRMPVPVSMWQPWLELVGETGGAAAHFFADPVVEFAGLRIAPLICYEQLLIWPVLQSMLHSPDAIVAMGNGWWTSNTNITGVQQAIVVSWAKLFDISVVNSFNR